MAKLILASASPRREELLKKMGLEFTVVASKINEEEYSGLSPVTMVRKLAQAKAEEVAELVENAIIIAADTVVVHNDEVIGKPADKQEAELILKRLRDSRHTVITGLAIFSTDKNNTYVEHDETDVYMRYIEDREIAGYIDTGEPLDKAGAYGIQGLGGIFVEKINGSFFTVVGLPIHKLVLMLKKLSMEVV